MLRDIGQVVQSTGPQAGAVRSFQAARAVAVTMADLVSSGDANRLTSSLRSMLRGESIALDDEGFAIALRKLFENLGVTYVKLGQFIASSPTLFPEAYVREFQKCLDQTTPIPFDTVRRVVEEDLGKPLGELFRSFDRTPLASASVAQVHAAVLQSGEDVVVKVRKPGISGVMEADLGFLYVAVRVLEFLNPNLGSSSLSGLLGEIRNSMLAELDFQQELENLETFRTFLADNRLEDIAAAPRSYRELSTRRVLTMERFYGVPFVDLEGIRDVTPNPEATLINALNVWALSVPGELFHADVHAGNLLVLRDGRVGFIDFGNVGRVPPAIWSAVQDLGLSFAASNTVGMARALIAMGATQPVVDETRFAADLDRVISRIRNVQYNVALDPLEDGRVVARASVNEDDITNALFEIVRVSEDYGLRLPREFALLVKQVLYFDRYIKLLAPELDPMSDDRLVFRDMPREVNSQSQPGPFIEEMA